MDDQQYDPYHPKDQGSRNDDTSGRRPNKTEELEKNIAATVGVMRENINKVAQRGAGLGELEHKTRHLTDSAQGFRRGANRVRKQMWWKDMKMRMCLIAGIIILLVIIIVPVVVTRK